MSEVMYRAGQDPYISEMAGMMIRLFGLLVMLAASTYTDLKRLEVEDRTILFSAVVCLSMNLTLSVITGTNGSLIHMVTGALAGGIIGFVMFLFGMGFGDVKIMFVIGAYLGLGLFVLSLLFAALSGTLYGLIWKTLIRQKNLKDALPFVPFLFLGCLSAVIYNSFLGGLL